MSMPRAEVWQCSPGANRWNSEAKVHLLLDRVADVNAQGRPGGNASQAVASEGSEPTASLLLDHGAEVNAPDGNYGNAFQAMEQWSHSSSTSGP